MSKSESARITGAKSHGPTIEAGLRRSFQNALKHGFSAQTIVLPTEDASEFNQLLAAYTNQFQPDGPVELDLVHQMVAANWRLRRLSTIETQLFTNAIEHEEERAADRDDDEDDQPLTPAEFLTEAFSALANSPDLAFLHRTESRLERSCSSALRDLLQLQQLRQSRINPQPPPENKICKNEPTAHCGAPTLGCRVATHRDTSSRPPTGQSDLYSPPSTVPPSPRLHLYTGGNP